MKDSFLDGNAAAGALSDVFVAEITAAVTTCATCGDARPVGELHVYMDGPGVVLRCASCHQVQIRQVRADQRVWLDLQGVRTLQVQLPPDESRTRLK